MSDTEKFSAEESRERFDAALKGVSSASAASPTATHRRLQAPLLTDAVSHEPRPLTNDLKRPVELVGRNALLA